MARPAKPVDLPLSDQSALRAIVQKGTHKSRKITRARALLGMGAGKSPAAVQAEAGVSANQYYRLKRRYLAGGLAEALEERPRSGQPPKVTAALEAHSTSLACSEAPAGAARWTLSWLNERLVSLHYGPAISDETIRKVLKKPAQALAKANVVHWHRHGRIPGQPGGRTRRVPAARRGGRGAPLL